MSKQELIAQELVRLSDQDLDVLLAHARSLAEAHAEAAVPVLAAESALAKDWLSPEEDAAWASLQGAMSSSSNSPSRTSPNRSAGRPWCSQS